MKTNEMNLRKGEQGFTLVELAIVMIIIGLLITGILKGQEMIANAQVTATLSQMKGLDAAASTFRDTYNTFPGDMADATGRLNGCAAPCANAATPDGRITVGVGAALASGNEAAQFFLHLLAADMITGLDGTAGNTFGQEFPTAAVGGGYTIGHTASGDGGFPALRGGHYLTQNGTTAAVGGVNGNLSGTQAARIDRKADDGIADTGSTQGLGTVCHTGGVYDEGAANALCSIAYRIQG